MSTLYKRFENFSSKFVQNRHIDIWVPENYEQENNKRYAVLYMHDGQNIFDPQFAYTGIDWGIVPALEKLKTNGENLKEVIIVGIWNTDKRLDEYLPNKPFHSSRGETALDKIKPHLKGEILSDLYLQFLVTELKPFIDQSYRTLSGQENTYIMGSSMGGLISLYALCEYPHVFYGAGCLSTHWPIIRTLFRDYLKENMPDPSTHKIYFDFGTVGLDKEYEPHQNRIDTVMKNAGYTFGENWLTQKFEGAEHNEAAWRERIHIPLKFLLKK